MSTEYSNWTLVNERQVFLQLVTTLVMKILEEIGQETDFEELTLCTRSSYSLKNFHGFSFGVKTGLTKFGGNSLSIHWKDEPRLEMEWPGGELNPNRCLVTLFDNSQEWQDAFVELLRKHRDHITEHKKAYGKPARFERTIRTRQEEINRIMTHLFP